MLQKGPENGCPAETAVKEVSTAISKLHAGIESLKTLKAALLKQTTAAAKAAAITAKQQHDKQTPTAGKGRGRKRTAATVALAYDSSSSSGEDDTLHSCSDSSDGEAATKCPGQLCRAVLDNSRKQEQRCRTFDQVSGPSWQLFQSLMLLTLSPGPAQQEAGANATSQQQRHSGEPAAAAADNIAGLHNGSDSSHSAAPLVSLQQLTSSCMQQLSSSSSTPTSLAAIMLQGPPTCISMVQEQAQGAAACQHSLWGPQHLPDLDELLLLSGAPATGTAPKGAPLHTDATAAASDTAAAQQPPSSFNIAAMLHDFDQQQQQQQHSSQGEGLDPDAAIGLIAGRFMLLSTAAADPVDTSGAALSQQGQGAGQLQQATPCPTAGTRESTRSSGPQHMLGVSGPGEVGLPSYMQLVIHQQQAPAGVASAEPAAGATPTAAGWASAPGAALDHQLNACNSPPDPPAPTSSSLFPQDRAQQGCAAADTPARPDEPRQHSAAAARSDSTPLPEEPLGPGCSPQQQQMEWQSQQDQDHMLLTGLSPDQQAVSLQHQQQLVLQQQQCNDLMQDGPAAAAAASAGDAGVLFGPAVGVPAAARGNNNLLQQLQHLMSADADVTTGQAAAAAAAAARTGADDALQVLGLDEQKSAGLGSGSGDCLLHCGTDADQQQEQAQDWCTATPDEIDQSAAAPPAAAPATSSRSAAWTPPAANAGEVDEASLQRGSVSRAGSKVLLGSSPSPGTYGAAQGAAAAADADVQPPEVSKAAEDQQQQDMQPHPAPQLQQQQRQVLRSSKAVLGRYIPCFTKRKESYHLLMDSFQHAQQQQAEAAAAAVSPAAAAGACSDDAMDVDDQIEVEVMLGEEDDTGGAAHGSPQAVAAAGSRAGAVPLLSRRRLSTSSVPRHNSTASTPSGGITGEEGAHTTDAADAAAAAVVRKPVLPLLRRRGAAAAVTSTNSQQQQQQQPPTHAVRSDHPEGVKGAGASSAECSSEGIEDGSSDSDGGWEQQQQGQGAQATPGCQGTVPSLSRHKAPHAAAPQGRLTHRPSNTSCGKPNTTTSSSTTCSVPTNSCQGDDSDDDAQGIGSSSDSDGFEWRTPKRALKASQQQQQPSGAQAAAQRKATRQGRMSQGRAIRAGNAASSAGVGVGAAASKQGDMLLQPAFRASTAWQHSSSNLLRLSQGCGKRFKPVVRTESLLRPPAVTLKQLTHRLDENLHGFFQVLIKGAAGGQVQVPESSSTAAGLLRALLGDQHYQQQFGAAAQQAQQQQQWQQWPQPAAGAVDANASTAPAVVAEAAAQTFAADLSGDDDDDIDWAAVDALEAQHTGGDRLHVNMGERPGAAAAAAAVNHAAGSYQCAAASDGLTTALADLRHKRQQQQQQWQQHGCGMMDQQQQQQQPLSQQRPQVQQQGQQLQGQHQQQGQQQQQPHDLSSFGLAGLVGLSDYDDDDSDAAAAEHTRDRATELLQEGFAAAAAPPAVPAGTSAGVANSVLLGGTTVQLDDEAELLITGLSDGNDNTLQQQPQQQQQQVWPGRIAAPTFGCVAAAGSAQAAGVRTTWGQQETDGVQNHHYQQQQQQQYRAQAVGPPWQTSGASAARWPHWQQQGVATRSHMGHQYHPHHPQQQQWPLGNHHQHPTSVTVHLQPQQQQQQQPQQGGSGAAGSSQLFSQLMDDWVGEEDQQALTVVIDTEDDTAPAWHKPPAAPDGPGLVLQGSLPAAQIQTPAADGGSRLAVSGLSCSRGPCSTQGLASQARFSQLQLLHDELEDLACQLVFLDEAEADEIQATGGPGDASAAAPTALAAAAGVGYGEDNGPSSTAVLMGRAAEGYTPSAAATAMAVDGDEDDQGCDLIVCDMQDGQHSPLNPSRPGSTPTTAQNPQMLQEGQLQVDPEQQGQHTAAAAAAAGPERSVAVGSTKAATSFSKRGGFQRGTLGAQGSGRFQATTLAQLGPAERAVWVAAAKQRQQELYGRFIALALQGQQAAAAAAGGGHLGWTQLMDLVRSCIAEELQSNSSYSSRRGRGGVPGQSCGSVTGYSGVSSVASLDGNGAGDTDSSSGRHGKALDVMQLIQKVQLKHQQMLLQQRQGSQCNSQQAAGTTGLHSGEVRRGGTAAAPAVSAAGALPLVAQQRLFVVFLNVAHQSNLAVVADGVDNQVAGGRERLQAAAASPSAGGSQGRGRKRTAAGSVMQGQAGADSVDDGVAVALTSGTKIFLT